MSDMIVSYLRIGLTSARVANALVGLGVDPAGSPSTELVLWCEDADAFYEQAIVAGATVHEAHITSN